MPRGLIPILGLWLCLCSGVQAAPRLAFSPGQWNYGMIIQGTRIHRDVVVTNREPVSVTVRFLSTCGCLEVTPDVQVVPTGSRAIFHLLYDSTDDHGVTEKSFLVTTDLPGARPLRYWLRGTVRQQRPAAGASASVSEASPAVPSGAIAVTYYYSPGCRSCEEFLDVEIPRLQKALGRRILVVKRGLESPGAYEELAALASAQGQTVQAIPALRVGQTLLQGDRQIREGIAEALRQTAAAGSAPAPRPAAPLEANAPVAQRLAVLPVAAAGLIDGINPCAFTTLIFLLASLALAGRGRSEVLVIGALFSTAVFLSYFGIGLGLFSALRALTAIAVASLVLRWVLVAALVVLAGLSLYDYTLIRSGRSGQILLQLPSSFKRRIHASIRSRARMAALAGSSLVLGFLVSVFEFACTGQVYLPLLGYLARTRRGDAVGLLALYNLCFILPLLVVFGASWFGVTSVRIAAAFQARMGAVKLALAAVFLGLAIVTLVG